MIKALNLTHYYQNDLALDGVNFDLNKGEFIALMGQSGSGKSTLLSILSSLLKPTSGQLFYQGKPFDQIKNIDTFRQKEISFVFQFHYLIGYLTVFENVMLASLSKDIMAIEMIFETLDISEIIHKYPDEISGGQRQRVAIARALVNQPKVLFADEPTGNLDSKNSQNIYELFQKLSHEGMSIVVATHDKALASFADRIMEVRDGKIF